MASSMVDSVVSYKARLAREKSFIVILVKVLERVQCWLNGKSACRWLFFQLKIGWDVPFYNLIASIIHLFFDTELARVFVDLDKRGNFHRHQPIPDLHWHREPCRDLTSHRVGVKLLR